MPRARGSDVHVGDLRHLLRKLRELEVVRGEQRQAAVALGQFERDRRGQRQAVEGRGAAADLVHQHQRVLGRGVQDRRRLGHLDHEGRAPRARSSAAPMRVAMRSIGPSRARVAGTKLPQ